MTAPIRYARSGDVNIAYQVTGDGPFDLVLVPGFFSHLEIDWEYPRHGAHARAARILRAADPLRQAWHRPLRPRPSGSPTSRRGWTTSARSWMRPRATQAALFGYSEGGPMCVLFAATYPDRTRALVLYGTYAKRRDPDDDYPWAPTAEARLAYAQELEETWGENVDISKMSPNADEAMRLWYQRRGRASLSPAGARDLILMNSKADVRDVLSTRSVPDAGPPPQRRSRLATRGGSLHRVEDPRSAVRRAERGRSRAGPRARRDRRRDRGVPHWSASGARVGSRSSRRFSSPTSSGRPSGSESLGDAAWAALLGSHHEAVRRQLVRFSGEEVDTAGDGFLALFDGPARAIRCALEIREALGDLGLEVRAGVHTGEVERPAGGQAARYRCSRRSSDHVARRSGRRARELDDPRPCRRLRPRVRGPGRARAKGCRRPPQIVRRSLVRAGEVSVRGRSEPGASARRRPRA